MFSQYRLQKTPEGIIGKYEVESLKFPLIYARTDHCIQCLHAHTKTELLSSKEVYLKDRFVLEFWLICPLEGGPFLQFSRRQNIRDAFVQPEALG